MSKRGRPTEEERAARRDRVLDAAVAVFAAHGFGATSLDLIASTAGVTKRTLYVDVGDKAALFAAAVDREHDRIRAVAEGPLVDVAAEVVHVLHSEPAVALHRSVIAEAVRFPALAADFYDRGPAHSVDVLARALPEGAAAHHLATALYALLLGEPHRRRLLGLDPAPSREAATAHARSALALLGL